MQRCSSNTSSYQYCSHHPVGTCSCHLYQPHHHHHQSTSSSHQPSSGKNPFTMLFSSSSNTKSCSTQYSNPNNQNSKSFDELDYHSYPIITSSSPSSAVDCTLSLGTPSTRKTNNSVMIDNHRKSTSCLTSSSKYCKSWDVFQPNSKNHHQEQQRHTSSTAHNIKNIISRGYNSVNRDQTIGRRCANCDTTSTPLWRNGPRGPKSLCNACGIRYKKEERRATASTTTTSNVNVNGAVGEVMSHPNQQSWAPHHSQTQPRLSTSAYPTSSTTSHYHEFRFIGDDDRYHHHSNTNTSSTGSGGIPNFLSWRQPTLVHHYT
ncbi:hypothetical protein C5167_010115 [Papaver somniferum]|uniref:GATA-type domain-containing protein n=1 Tax=Papaver somniferum TaxID=3469 RepID=A0A4Y7K262_PAPSO|nr:GATA transcription factor 19-like [Papaver somniferum]RZC66420.1 hypothetical protein C5167_010115 [Papaver somniferum]